MGKKKMTCNVPYECFHCPYPDCREDSCSPTRAETKFYQCAELERSRAVRPSVGYHQSRQPEKKIMQSAIRFSF